MNTREFTTRQTWLAFLGLAMLICAFNLFGNRAFIFGPAVLETTDFAVNALQIIDAQKFHDIYGNYSRWGFNHPGPFFFYVYALGEKVLLNGLGLVNSPHQAHVFAGIVLQSLFLAGAICCFIGLTGRRMAGLIILACASAFLPATRSAITSIWPPHVLFGPYILLIVSCAAMAMGRYRWIPVAVFTVCVLCHGHVAQPLMSIPLIVAASGLYLRNARTEGVGYRAAIGLALPQLLASAAMVAVFLVPICVDLLRCPDCNAHRIVSYMHDSGRAARWGQAFNYIGSFFVFDQAPEWLSGVPKIKVLTLRTAISAAICALAFAVPGLMKKKLGDAEYVSLRTIVLFALLALVLSLIWAKKITGPLYAFNGFYIYGIVFVLVAVATCALVLPFCRPRHSTIAAVLLCALVTVVAFVYPAPKAFSSISSIRPAAPSAVPPRSLVLINQTDRGDWPAMVPMALWLKRLNVDFMVPRSWMFMYGWDRGSNAARILHAGTRVEIWESGKDEQMLSTGTFDPSAFCRISASSPEPSLSGSSDIIAKSRNDCSMTTFGLDIPKGQSEGWTDGNIAVFQFVGRHVESDVGIAFQARPYLGAGTSSKQTVRINVNGAPVRSLDVTTEGRITVVVPRETWNVSSVVTVTLYLPDAVSPSETGWSNDKRRLGLWISSVKVDYPAESSAR